MSGLLAAVDDRDEVICVDDGEGVDFLDRLCREDGDGRCGYFCVRAARAGL